MSDAEAITRALAELNKAEDALRAARSELATLHQPTGGVPYISQWDANAQMFKSDCGPACVAMLLAAQGVQVLVDDLSIECGMGPGKQYTMAADLWRVAGRHGLKLEIVTGWNVGQFSQHLPAIALVHYGSIPDRLDQHYTAGHWMVVIGVDAEAVTVHDPDWFDPHRDEGANRRIPLAVFEQALADCKLDYNRVGHGLVKV